MRAAFHSCAGLRAVNAFLAHGGKREWQRDACRTSSTFSARRCALDPGSAPDRVKALTDGSPADLENRHAAEHLRPLR
jgi:hypothetical protein